MSNVRRIYVEKKDAFAVKAKELQEEIQSYPGDRGCEGRAGADPLRCGEHLGRGI